MVHQEIKVMKEDEDASTSIPKLLRDNETETYKSNTMLYEIEDHPGWVLSAILGIQVKTVTFRLGPHPG